MSELSVVVGVDPGVTTGIVVLSFHGDRLLRSDAAALQVHGHLEVPHIVEMLIDRHPFARPRLAIEQFVVGPRASKSIAPFAGKQTRDLVAALQSLAVDQNNGTALDVITRPAALVKPWATDRRLDAAGLTDITKGMPHARDAARHALYAAVHAGITRDPLSTKATG